MRPSLLGLGLLAPTAPLGQVVETVWVRIGDYYPTGGTDDSSAGDVRMIDLALKDFPT